jgi:hypothetical protein
MMIIDCEIAGYSLDAVSTEEGWNVIELILVCREEKKK